MPLPGEVHRETRRRRSGLPFALVLPPFPSSLLALGLTLTRATFPLLRLLGGLTSLLTLPLSLFPLCCRGGRSGRLGSRFQSVYPLLEGGHTQHQVPHNLVDVEVDLLVFPNEDTFVETEWLEIFVIPDLVERRDQRTLVVIVRRLAKGSLKAYSALRRVDGRDFQRLPPLNLKVDPFLGRNTEGLQVQLARRTPLFISYEQTSLTSNIRKTRVLTPPKPGGTPPPSLGSRPLKEATLVRVPREFHQPAHRRALRLGGTTGPQF